MTEWTKDVIIILLISSFMCRIIIISPGRQCHATHPPPSACVSSSSSSALRCGRKQPKEPSRIPGDAWGTSSRDRHRFCGRLKQAFEHAQSFRSLLLHGVAPRRRRPGAGRRPGHGRPTHGRTRGHGRARGRGRRRGRDGRGGARPCFGGRVRVRRCAVLLNHRDGTEHGGLQAFPQELHLGGGSRAEELPLGVRPMGRGGAYCLGGMAGANDVPQCSAVFFPALGRRREKCAV